MVPAVSSLPAHDLTYGIKSPTKLKATVDILVEKLNEKSNLLQNAVRREKTLTANVADLVKQLREQEILTEEGEQLLKTYKNMPQELFSGKAGGPGGMFSDEQRHFAITMYYYSPAAYEF